MSKIVKALVAGFLLGVAAELLFGFGFYFSVFIVFLSFVLLPVLSGPKKYLICAALLFAALGMFRAEFVPSREDSVFKNMEGRTVTLEGVIAEEPDVRENSIRLVVEANGEKLLVVVKRFPEYEYGEGVSLTGKIEAPENFQSQDGRDFDYVSYLRKNGIFYEMSFPKIEVVSQGEGNAVIGTLLAWKHAFINRVSQVLPEPHASLIGGLLLGTKRSLGVDLLNDFRIAGIIHIVVLSGYNITVIADFMMRALSLLPRIAGMAGGAIGIVLFAMMTGAGASTVRASLMALLVLFARATGRTEDSLHLLFVAAFFMVLLNPLILLYDPSFQLSFLATLGLFTFGPHLAKKFSRIPKKFGLRETVAATLSTQVFVLPMLLYQTGIFSVVALPVNVFVLPIIPLAMLFGLLTGAAAFVFLPLASCFGFIAYLLLSYILTAVGFASHLPFASITLPAFSPALVAAAYLLYFLLWRRNEKKSKVQISNQS